MTDTNLVLAIPSKGRLMEAAEAYFSEAGLKVERRGGSRIYQGALKGVEGVEVRFLSASEIASGLIAGDIHLGITGRDLLHEKTADPDKVVAPLSALQFGHADVIVAVPQAWLDVETMADLAEVSAEMRAENGRFLRVATKFTNMTRTFFAGHGIVDYRIVESLGATEGAPAAGTAEAIVDITSSGATLTANHLKILDDGVILNSEAFLCASMTVEWSEAALRIVEEILARLAAREQARRTIEMRIARVEASAVAVKSLAKKHGATEALGEAGDSEQELVLHVPTAALHTLAQDLKALGCNVITARKVDYIYARTNSLYETLLMELKTASDHSISASVYRP